MIVIELANTNDDSNTPIITENDDHKKSELIREEENTMPISISAAEVEIVFTY
jgi:hypothetical protein